MAAQGSAKARARRAKVAARPYLRYAATDALRQGAAQGSLSGWPRPANFVVERHAGRWNVRMTCTIMPTRLRHAALCRGRVRRPISSNECSAINGPIRADRSKTIFPPGPSPTTGRSACRSRAPRWMCCRGHDRLRRDHGRNRGGEPVAGPAP